MTLTTDFGLCDAYVAEMKAVLLRARPGLTIVDVTHEVPPQNVLAGSIVLERVLRAFGSGTIHVAVVDPGVGSDRKVLVALINHQWLIAPDNGLITWAWRRLGPARRVYELTWRPDAPISRTFHGRDLIAPAAARLATGTPITRLARPLGEPVLLDAAPIASLDEPGEVIHIDHFGNATTNIPGELLAGQSIRCIEIGRRSVPLCQAYADVAVGRPLALVGSSGLVEIAVRDGAAAGILRLVVGDCVRVKRGCR